MHDRQELKSEIEKANELLATSGDNLIQTKQELEILKRQVRFEDEDDEDEDDQSDKLEIHKQIEN